MLAKYGCFIVAALVARCFLQRILQLEDIFHVGQAVVTRVIEINRSSEYNAKVILTLVPDVVQSDWSPRSVTAGCVIIAAVKSQEENGYIMDTGIKNVRAFLKRSAALKYEKTCNQERLLGEFMQEMLCTTMLMKSLCW
jgi:hypothetical protein